MIDISKQANGTVKIDYGIGEPQYLGNLDNLNITGKANAVFSTNPLIQKPQVRVLWSTGGVKVFLDNLSVDGVPQTDLEDALAAVSEAFDGEVV